MRERRRQPDPIIKAQPALRAQGAHVMSFFRCTIACLVLVFAACSEPPVTATDSAAATPAAGYNLTLGMKDFMNLVLEPTADVLWDSAGWVNDIETGYQELYPTTDADWDMVRQRAAQIVEAGNSLALPGRAVDSDAWLTYSNALSAAGAMAMEAAAVRNQEDFFQAGAQMYSVCSACHQTYNPEISRFTSN
jgi:hypothetical protein